VTSFLENWNQAALTTAGFFWKALWAFVLGYLVSGCIQVFVTRQRMQNAMGETGARSVGLATFFGFISSSCSFAALAGAKSVFQKGAGLIPALAFLLASTNLVIELGIVISIFLGWQFVVGEYLGGILLILFMWLFVRLLYPKKLIEETRKRLESEDDTDNANASDWKERIRSLEGWQDVASKYFMEWKMVWKDVTIGFTVAGIITVFVSADFFKALFVGSGGEVGFFTTILHSLIGPVAAFFTFIGSMGNIPLAAVLFSSGVSFAGVMAFIFSDLVVLPVIRMNAKFYGWKMAGYIAGIFLLAIVASAVAMHWLYAGLGILPEGANKSSQGGGPKFEIDFTFWMNLIFLTLTAVLVWLQWRKTKNEDSSSHSGESKTNWRERILTIIAITAYSGWRADCWCRSFKNRNGLWVILRKKLKRCSLYPLAPPRTFPPITKSNSSSS
jgi:uncharacterized membrane protein YraQ (UPF0718 family)